MVQALLYLFVIRAVDLYERESLRYVVPVFIWGFAVATTLSLILNTIASITLASLTSQQVAAFFTAVFVAPPVEETTKGLALLIAFLVAYAVARRRGLVEFAGVMDGIVYGCAVGFGFGLAEDILYGLQYGPETFVVRRIFGGFAHAAFTSLTGIGIGLIPWVSNRALKVLFPLLGLLGAILLHATFNFLASTLGGFAYVLMFLVLLVYAVLIILWLRSERHTIRDELREEVEAGTITPEEYAILPTYFRRTGYYLKLVFTGRLRTYFQARKVHGAAVDLAVSKRLARRASTSSRRDRVLALRNKVLNLKGVATPRTNP